MYPKKRFCGLEVCGVLFVDLDHNFGGGESLVVVGWKLANVIYDEPKTQRKFNQIKINVIRSL